MNNLKNGQLFKLAVLNSLGVLVYVFLVSLFMNNGSKIFGQADNKLLTPIIALMLFIVSALITGYLVLGKPIMLFLENEKKAGLKLLAYTGICLVAILIIVGLILYFIK